MIELKKEILIFLIGKNMREIKFRAWDKTLGKFTFYFHLQGAMGGQPLTVKELLDLEIMQYTGLKDKNGKEIYEGDIVKTPYNDTYDFAYYKVDFVEGEYYCNCIALHHKENGFKDISRGGYCTGNLKCYYKKGEVIGNIYENKDLIN